MPEITPALQRAESYPALSSRPKSRRSAADIDAPATVMLPASRSLILRDAQPNGEPTPNADGTVTVCGFASVTETGYEMYDYYGPYTEIVSLDAFDQTLAAAPLVEFTLNHNKGGGAPMAHTRNGTLRMWVVTDGDVTGLYYEADVDPTRTDVADMLKALARGDLAEASFKFQITSGQWSPDYMEFRINTVDLNRGDVSSVNFGANPSATSQLRGEAGSERGRQSAAPDERSDDDIEEGRIERILAEAKVAKREQRRTEPADAERYAALRMQADDLAFIAERAARALGSETDPISALKEALGLFLAIDNIVDSAQANIAAYLGIDNPDLDADEGDDEDESGTEVELSVGDDEIEHRHIYGI